MTDELRARAYQLLKALPEVPPADCERILREKATEDPELAAAALWMLRNALESSELPEPVQVPDPFLGRRIDGWLIKRFLGSGGYGRVYQATRTLPGGESEEVAIKFLDVEPCQTVRFLQERQLLSGLIDDGICRFLGGGSGPAGRPYMVMEYVAGLPITSHCDRFRLSVTERLELFVKVCRAVEYAHRQGVIHRDLKPANILVTAGGAVRIIDFGVAQLLDQQRAPAQRLTRQGETPWTRAYASPEQIKGDPLSLATDVYSLGVVLYQLLCGQLPFSPAALSGADWAEVIAEREPLPPSRAALAPDPETQDRAELSPANARRSTPARLKRTLAGNLDAVVLAALRKAPHLRYPRVERLREDLALIMEGLPVSVRRCGLWERVRSRSAKCPAATLVIAAAFLAVFYPFLRGFPGQIEDRAAFQAQNRAMQRLQRLTSATLPRLEDSLPPALADVRRLTAGIHTRLLQNVEVLPDYALRELDDSLAVSALRCAEEWQSLGDPAAALAATAPVLPRVASRYESERRDRPRREIYLRLLRQRIGLHEALQQQAEAADERQLLEQVLRGR